MTLTPEQQARAAAEEIAGLVKDTWANVPHVDTMAEIITKHSTPAPSLATAIEKVKALQKTEDGINQRVHGEPSMEEWQHYTDGRTAAFRKILEALTALQGEGPASHE